MAKNYFNNLKSQKNLTLGWDVVVSYGEKEINEFLAAAYLESDSKHSIAELSCQGHGVDNSADKYTIDYDFVLAAPKIHIAYSHDAGHLCQLTIPIRKGSAKASSNGAGISSESIEDGVYQLVLRGLRPAMASGSSTEITPIDVPLTFTEGSNNDGMVVLDIPTSDSLAVDVERGPQATETNTAKSVESFKTDLAEKIKEKLQVDYKDVRLVLARVNSSSPPKDAVQLKPKSFMFSLLSGESLDQPVLSLFVQTASSNFGETNDVVRSRKWASLWLDTLKSSPLRPGHTTSIIIHKQFFFDEMIRPSLKRAGFTSSVRDTTGDLSLSIKTGRKIRRDKCMIKIPLKGAPLFHDQGFISTIHADPGPILLNFAVRPFLRGFFYIFRIAYDLANIQTFSNTRKTNNDITICSGSANFSFKFDWVRQLGSNGPFVRNGIVTVTNTLKTSLGPVTTLDGYRFGIAVSIKKGDWTQTLSANGKGFLDQFFGVGADIPDWMKSLVVEVNNLEIDCGKLYHFVTTNLLTPPRKVISIDKDIGLQVVGDVYLGGSVVDLRHSTL
ncbi:hypothetical protein GGR50DRAFT_696244 [Xylaria sp. CBS 124048]|nr:hypothetical protein GGR50DRAFT_696244 [Xylaria sp. CBS 124048]